MKNLFNMIKTQCKVMCTKRSFWLSFLLYWYIHFGAEELLSGIQLELESGHIYGLIGRNGSGKSMLFRILSGLVKPTAGEVIVDGKKLFADMETIENVGVIIENEEMYPEFTGCQNLKFLADIKKWSYRFCSSKTRMINKIRKIL